MPRDFAFFDGAVMVLVLEPFIKGYLVAQFSFHEPFLMDFKQRRRWLVAFSPINVFKRVLDINRTVSNKREVQVRYGHDPLLGKLVNLLEFLSFSDDKLCEEGNAERSDPVVAQREGQGGDLVADREVLTFSVGMDTYGSLVEVFFNQVLLVHCAADMK